MSVQAPQAPSTIRPLAVQQERHEDLAEQFGRLARETPGRRGVDVTIRALDVALSLFFLLLSLPAILVIVAAQLLTSGRPVFYRGERVGRGGRVFTMTKFRTLKPGAEGRLGHYLGPELVARTEAEVTRLGRWLRTTQLDEVPQFWNVLTGDMSLVGPRPIRPRFFEELAVLYNLDAAVLVSDGLVAGLQVDDREAARGQSDAAVQKRTCAVGAAMHERLAHRCEPRGVDRAAGGGDPADPAHGD